jgi:hypothetical protein
LFLPGYRKVSCISVDDSPSAQVIERTEGTIGETQARYTVRCSLLQIYQNEVLDMLRPTGKPLQLSETDKGVQPRDLHEEVVLNGVHKSA